MIFRWISFLNIMQETGFEPMQALSQQISNLSPQVLSLSRLTAPALPHKIYWFSLFLSISL